jgi:hypothetical protein
MAAGAFQVFRRAKPKLLDGTMDLNSDTLKMALCAAAEALTDDFAGSSTDCRYADLAHEVPNGSGYTTGGNTLTPTVTRSGATVKFDVDDQSWTASTFDCKYAVIYDDTDANKGLIAFCDLDTSGGSLSPSGGTLAININASGVFTLA